MLKHKRIKVGKKYIEAISIGLLSKSLILLKGRKGYVMCGYLNLKAAQKFQDTAVKIVGVSSIEEALRAEVYSCTSQARRLGIFKGQAVKEALTIIT